MSADERKEHLNRALIMIVAVLVAIVVVVALGTVAVVKGLGLSDDGGGSAAGGPSPEAPSALPSSALPSPSSSGDPSDDQTFDPSASPSAGELALSASPTTVGASQRINLTGDYPGKDNVSIEVQRLEGGSWADFGVQANVRVGTYATYILTGRTGQNQFRMFDPQTQTASAPVTITVQ